MIEGFPGAGPRPEQRGPKPKKPIARKTAPRKVRKSAARAAELKADREWSLAVRAKGPCAAIGRWKVNWGTTDSGGSFIHYLVHRECHGRIDPAHIFRRGYDATRHDVRNGLPLCRFIHDWFGRNSQQFEAFVRLKIGDVEYERLHAKAMAGPVEKL